MSRLPIAVSIPHAGLRVPQEVADLCRLSSDELRADGDDGLAEICRPLIETVEVYATTQIARAIVDLDRPEHDRGPDGVVKSRTRDGSPVYRTAPTPRQVDALLQRYYRPYHEQLSRRAERVQMGVDWHVAHPRTGQARRPAARAAEAAPSPAIDPGAGAAPPASTDSTASTADVTLAAVADTPGYWVTAFSRALRRHLAAGVTLRTEPRLEGHIASSMPGGVPWLRVELAPAAWAGAREPTELLVSVVTDFYRAMQRIRGH